MLGIAARNSIRNETGATRNRGAIRTRKSAAPKLTGTAITNAIIELTAVPKITGSAPNFGGSVSVTISPSTKRIFPSGPRLGTSSNALGRQSVCVRKLSPNARMLGIAEMVRTHSSEVSINSTVMLAPRVSARSTRSPLKRVRRPVSKSAAGGQPPTAGGIYGIDWDIQRILPQAVRARGERESFPHRGRRFDRFAFEADGRQRIIDLLLHCIGQRRV